jgi:outer membrane lipoprotein-sorting protein
MINWNFQRKQMRENMRKNVNASEEVIITNSNNTPTYFGEIYLYEGTLVKVSYKTSANSAVVTFLEGEDKDKVGTINLNNAKLVKENK